MRLVVVVAVVLALVGCEQGPVTTPAPPSPASAPRPAGVDTVESLSPGVQAASWRSGGQP
jgi:hypothetical protein